MNLYDMKLENNWIYMLLLLSVVLAILALLTSDFIFKSGTAGMGVLIIIILNFTMAKPSRDTWLIIGAFLFSIAGDWFLSNKGGDPLMFSKGIAMFFLAHMGYLMYAIYNGQINWRFTLIVLAAFLVYFFVMLYPAFDDKVLMLATLIYLLVSCFSFGASVGIKGSPLVKWAYVAGIFLILFSDTIISLNEFLSIKSFNFLILPTYYLAHLSITYSLIRKTGLEKLSVSD